MFLDIRLAIYSKSSRTPFIHRTTRETKIPIVTMETQVWRFMSFLQNQRPIFWSFPRKLRHRRHRHVYSEKAMAFPPLFVLGAQFTANRAGQGISPNSGNGPGGYTLYLDAIEISSIASASPAVHASPRRRGPSRPLRKKR